MRTEPFVIDVTVTGFISGFICGPPDAQILHLFFWGGGGESIGGGQAPPGVRVILTLRLHPVRFGNNSGKNLLDPDTRRQNRNIIGG